MKEYHPLVSYTMWRPYVQESISVTVTVKVFYLAKMRLGFFLHSKTHRHALGLLGLLGMQGAL